MRELPPDVAAQLAPLPAWFSIHPHVSKSGLALRWSDTLATRDEGPVEFEYGLPIRSGSEGEMSALTDQLRAAAWQICELVRIHRLDLVHPARADRHSNRPAAGRPLTPEATQFLAGVQQAHAQRLERHSG